MFPWLFPGFLSKFPDFFLNFLRKTELTGFQMNLFVCRLQVNKGILSIVACFSIVALEINPGNYNFLKFWFWEEKFHSKRKICWRKTRKKSGNSISKIWQTPCYSCSVKIANIWDFGGNQLSKVLQIISTFTN